MKKYKLQYSQQKILSQGDQQINVYSEQNRNNQDHNGLIDYRLIHGLVTYAVYRQETTMA